MTVVLPVVNQVGDYATVPCAARMTGVPRSTLIRAIERGDVHAVRLDGRTVLVSLASARAYTPRRKVGATGTGVPLPSHDPSQGTEKSDTDTQPARIGGE